MDELARYLAVVVLLDHERLPFKASTLAASLVIIACLAAGYEESSHVVIEVYTLFLLLEKKIKRQRKEKFLRNN